jgi:hypothetical protein
MRQNCIGWQLKLALTLTGKQTSWQPTSRGWLSLDRAAGRLEILTAQLPPHLARRRRGELTSYTRLISGLVRDRAATAAAGVRGRPRAPCARNKRWGDRPLCAHRPDPVQRTVGVNERHHHLGRRSSSSATPGDQSRTWAKSRRLAQNLVCPLESHDSRAPARRG